MSCSISDVPRTHARTLTQREELCCSVQKNKRKEKKRKQFQCISTTQGYIVHDSKTDEVYMTRITQNV